MPDGPEILRVIGYDDTNPDQPPQIMGVGEEFYPVIGRIVIQWALMEQEASNLLYALQALNGSPKTASRREFADRWRSLLHEFAKLADGVPGLKKEMNEIDRLVKAAKPVRDGIAHNRIMSVLSEQGAYIRFEVPQKNNPWSKAYFLVDLQRACSNVSDAAGRLYRLMDVDHPTSRNLPGREVLRALPDVNAKRFPVRPPRSFKPGVG